jgi:transposase
MGAPISIVLQPEERKNDPLFSEKLEDVVGLYLNPPDNAAVFYVDEKSSIQALDRTQPGLPLKKGRAETMTHDYKRHGTSTLFAALDVFTGKVIGECKQRHRHQEFLGFLKVVEKQTPKDKDLLVVVDNYSTHKQEKVKNRLKRIKHVTLHFIPTSSSWLNLVERFFGSITEKQIRRGVFTSVADLENKDYAVFRIAQYETKTIRVDKASRRNYGKNRSCSFRTLK